MAADLYSSSMAEITYALITGASSGIGECFARALELDRNFAESHGGLAVVAALSGDAQAARAHAQRALGLDAECVSARYAASLLAGEIRDEATFREVARRLLSGRGDLLAVLARRGRPG